MDITLNKKDSTNASIKIIIKEADYQTKFEQKVKEYSKKANVKGFRPGKVPAGYIKKLYGKSILVEEINQMLSSSLNNYIKENDLKILGDPVPNEEQMKSIDWDNQKEFEFDYDLGLVDEFEVSADKKIKVNKHNIKVDEKLINETIDNLRNQYGKSESVEESKAKDVLEGKLSTKDEEVQEKAVLPLEDLEKKAEKDFKGLKKGDTVTVKVDKAFKTDEAKARFLNKSEEEAKADKEEYTFLVQDIKRTEPAELNQELFDQVFGKDAVKSEEEFKNKIKDTIGENYQRETDNLLNRDIQDAFVDQTKFDLPDEFLKKWLLISNEGKIDKDQIEKEYEFYAKDLRWNLIKNQIAEKNEIKVEHEDVMEYTKNMIKEQFGAYGMSDQMGENMDSFANNYLQGENGQNYMKVFEQLRTERVLEFVKDKITVKDKDVDLDGFKKAAESN